MPHHAYDDVPLTLVVRTGEPVLGDRAALAGRFGIFVSQQPPDVHALAAVPLPGVGSPIGGLVLYLEDDWLLDDPKRRLLEATARSAAEAVRRIRIGGEALHNDDPETDDEGRIARIVLDDDPRAAGQARRFLREFLDGAGIDEEPAYTAQLCLSELVTNAIVHALGRCEVRAALDPSNLLVSVRDRGGSAPDAEPDADPDPLRVHGRGLQLVEALADRWGSDRDAVGTTVWFALDLAG